MNILYKGEFSEAQKAEAKTIVFWDVYPGARIHGFCLPEASREEVAKFVEGAEAKPHFVYICCTAQVTSRVEQYQHDEATDEVYVLTSNGSMYRLIRKGHPSAR